MDYAYGKQVFCADDDLLHEIIQNKYYIYTETIKDADFTGPDICDYFQCVGTPGISLIKFRVDEIHSIYKIRFGFPQDARIALENVHYINGKPIRMSMKKCVKTENKSIELEPYEQPSPGGLNLLELNDHCLRLIFQSFNLTELIPVTRTCKRLKGFVLEEFRSKLNVLNVGAQYQSSIFHPTQIANVVKTFGPNISKLSISLRGNNNSNRDNDQQLLEKVATHCTSLKVLKLLNVTLKGETTPQVNALFKKLKELKIINCYIWPTFYTVLDNCASLVKLKIDRLTVVTFLNSKKNFLMEKRFPKLESFWYSCELKCFRGAIANCRTFLEYHKLLKKVNIRCCSVYAVHHIAPKCEVWEEICFDQPIIFSAKSDHLYFKNLKKLKTPDAKVLSMLDSQSCLEYLAIERLDQECLDKCLPLKELQTLSIFDDLDIAALKERIQRTPGHPVGEINHLIIKTGKYCSLIDIVTIFKKLRTLTIHGEHADICANVIRTICRIYSARNRKLIFNNVFDEQLRTKFDADWTEKSQMMKPFNSIITFNLVVYEFPRPNRNA